MTKMRLGVFGGTFNPIHFGHLHIAQEFARMLGLSQVLFVPTAMPPHKQAEDLAPAADRFELCRMAVRDHPFCRVNDTEIRRGGKSYTVDTLRILTEQYPDTRLFLLMGEDMFLTLQNWREPEKIWQMADICAAPRSAEPGDELYLHQEYLETLGARVHICPIIFLSVSSTMVREKAAKGESLAGLVPPPVERYIKEHGLYRRA